MLRSKKLLSTLSALVLCVSLGTTAFAADLGSANTETAQEEWAYLNVVVQGIKIYAPESDILKYVDASDEATKDQALLDLISDPNNSVSELNGIPFERVPDATDINEVEIEPARSPGTWTITGHVVPYGGTTQYGSFDIAWNESLHLVYNMATDHIVGWACATSLPNIPSIDFRHNIIAYYTDMPSGQYYIYVKNFGPYDMTVTGGYIEVYS